MNDSSALRVAAYGALATVGGTVVSGPVALALVATTHPQPAWQGADVFAASYHPMQTLPFFAGLILVSGFVVLIAGLHAAARSEEKARTSIALVFTSVFASLVFFNYVVQTTFVPALMRSGEKALAASFTMSNPSSLAWGLEMWGYGFLGVATWLVASTFRGGGLERATARVFVANGAVSVVGALATAAFPGWVMTPRGFAAFAAWNLLVVAMGAFAFAALRRRGVSAPTAGFRPGTRGGSESPYPPLSRA